MFLNGQFQNGYVTRNLEKAAETVGKHLGIAHFDFDDVAVEVVTPAGSGVAEFSVALGWHGPRHIELIQPRGGLVELYRNWLPTDDALRFHHFGMRCDSLQPVRANAVENGWEIVVEGSVPGIDFLYVDATPTLGHYLEYMCATPEGWAGLRWPEGMQLR